MLVAVSDGAGSAARADIGAAVAVSHSLNRLAEEIADQTDPRDAIYAAFNAAKAELARRAESENTNLREYSATLLMVALGPDGGAFGQIGDGVIAVKADPDDWSYLVWPQNGEYANTTHFVTDQDADEWFQCDSLGRDICELALITDGLEPLALQLATKSVHSPFFEGIASPLRGVTHGGECAELSEHLQSLLQSPQVQNRADDDLTLVIGSRLKP